MLLSPLEDFLEISKAPQEPKGTYLPGLLVITELAFLKLMSPQTLFCKMLLRSHKHNTFIQIRLKNIFLQSSTSLLSDFLKTFDMPMALRNPRSEVESGTSQAMKTLGSLLYVYLLASFEENCFKEHNLENGMVLIIISQTQI